MKTWGNDWLPAWEESHEPVEPITPDRFIRQSCTAPCKPARASCRSRPTDSSASPVPRPVSPPGRHAGHARPIHPPALYRAL